MIDFNKPKHLVIGMHYNDPPAPNATESTGDVLSAYINYLPALMSTTSAQILPSSQAELDASKVISPQENQLMLELYQKFAPQLAKTGSEIDAATRAATATADVNILGNQGAQLANIYKQIDKSLNPEYYQVREQSAKSLGDLLAANDLSRPNIEAERLVNQENIRSGNATTPSATNTVANAIQFGNEGQKRANNLSNAISTATGFLQPSSNAQFNPATAILNKPTSSTGTSQFAGVTPASKTATETGGNLLNNITGLQQSAMDINANRRDILDRLNQTTQAVGSL